MDALVAWLQATTLSRMVVQSLWIWPFCETIHFVGLGLVIGVAGFFDLRLIGFMKRVPVSAAKELMPFAVWGFLLNLTTGIVFVVGHPEQYAHNSAFVAKMGFLLLAGLNAVLFEWMVSAQVVDLGAGDETPAMAKVIGTLSLVSWFAVLYCGRMLPFIGNAF